MSGPYDPPPVVNPYAPPEASLEEARPSGVPADLTEAERIRRLYLNHEWSIRSLGGLHLIGAVFYIVVVIGVVVEGIRGRGGAGDVPSSLPAIGIFGLVFLGGIGFNVALGLGLRGLKNWARWLEVVIIGLFLLARVLMFGLIAVGGAGMVFGLLPLVMPVLILGYVLYLLLSAKGRVVFSPDYQEIIALTPHVKYKTSCLVKGLLWFLLALIVFGVAAAIFTG